MSYNESLSPNSNYPPMSQSQWDSAPWNEKEVPERDFDVDVEYVLRKTVSVNTNDYIPEYDEEDGHTYANTEDTDWEKAYAEEHYTITELLSELESYIKQDLERYKGNATKEKQLKEMLEDCKDWEVEEESYSKA